MPFIRFKEKKDLDRKTKPEEFKFNKMENREREYLGYGYQKLEDLEWEGFLKDYRDLEKGGVTSFYEGKKDFFPKFDLNVASLEDQILKEKERYEVEEQKKGESTEVRNDKLSKEVKEWIRKGLRYEKEWKWNEEMPLEAQKKGLPPPPDRALSDPTFEERYPEEEKEYCHEFIGADPSLTYEERKRWIQWCSLILYCYPSPQNKNHSFFLGLPSYFKS